MPSGRTHAAISTITAIAIYGIGMNSNQPEIIYQAIAGGCVAGIVITPDLDVDKPVRSHYIILRNLGPVVAIIWRMFWLPYGLAIKHRSWISHMPIIGTIIRASYLIFIMLLFMWILKLMDIIILPLRDFLPILPWILIGLIISDFLHWAADILWSGLNRSLKL